MIKFIFFLMLIFQSVSADAKEWELDISLNRPRLILSSEIFERDKSFNKIINSDYIAKIKKYSEWRVMNTDSGQFNNDDFVPEVILPLAYWAKFSNNNKFIDYCKIITVNFKIDKFKDFRNNLIAISIVYDWLWQFFSARERQIVREKIYDLILLVNDEFKNNICYSGGHSRLGSISILYGIISIYDDLSHEQFLLLQGLYRLYMNHWADGFIPFQKWVMRDGGYHMGWSYGNAYTSLWFYFLFDRIAPNLIGNYADLLSKQIEFYIYGLRGDQRFPGSGDCFSTEVSHSLMPLFSLDYCINNNSNSAIFYKQHFEKLWWPYHIWPVLIGCRFPTFITDSYQMLPFFKHFQSSGYVVARNSWGENSVQLVFKSSPFYSLNHQHKDQNHFELSYKGSLIIDSGSYQPPGYGSSHWKNYYTRTIAHNSMVVYDDQENFILNNEVLSNDGGQKFVNFNDSPIGNEPCSLNEVLNTKYFIGGISNYKALDGAVWMQGNASLAYSSSKLKSYVRDIVMINESTGKKLPVFIVLDQILLSKYLDPKIIFHSNSKPNVSAKSFMISNAGGGIVNGYVVYPSLINLQLVGGPGKEWYVSGKNYDLPLGWREESVKRGIDPGSWRIEIGGGKTISQTFMTFFEIKDQGEMGLLSPVYFEGIGYIGVGFGDSAVIWLDTNSNNNLEIFESWSNFYIVNRDSINKKKLLINNNTVMVGEGSFSFININ